MFTDGMEVPPVAIGNSFARVASAQRELITPEERAMFDCALRHVMDTYHLPRYFAADVAVRILALGQPAWTPYPCPHEARHDKPRPIVCYVCSGCGALIRPKPDGEYEHGPEACCFICGKWLEPRFDEPSRSEIDGDSRTPQKPLAAGPVPNQAGKDGA